MDQPSSTGGELGAAILAAGLGRRLEPLTAHHLPKPMFPLGGRTPMVDGWVRALHDAGVQRISMNTCVLPHTIERHFSSVEPDARSVDFVREEIPSGTLGGACRQAFGPRPFTGSTLLVPSGDIVTDFGAGDLEEMLEIHRAAGAACSIILVPVPWERRKDYGTVELADPTERPGQLSRAGRIRAFYEKDPEAPSNLNNASIYLIEMDLLRELEKLRTPADLGLERPFYDFGKHVFPALLGRLPGFRLSRDYPLWGVEYDGEWHDVGQKRDYLSVHEHLLSGRLPHPIPYSRRPWGYLGSGTEIDESKVEIEAPVVIGEDCVIEPGATLGPFAVIGDGWRVGAGATVRRSVLWPHYPFFYPDGSEIGLDRRREMDPHRIGEGVRVEGSILAGGDLREDAHDATVEVLADGTQSVRSIDWVPDAPRA